MRLPLQIGLAVTVLVSATDAQAQTRFQGMDQNNDGVITRTEWRGNDRLFRNQDWNGDGVLSGDEVRPGAQRQNWNQDWNRDGIVDNQDNQIAQRFRGYDMDNDGRVAASEWPGDQRLFTRLDTNRDRYLSMQEYTTGAGFRLDAQGGPAYRFSNIDMNRDGWVTRNEWTLDDVDFNRLDINRDNRISRFEFENDTASDNDPNYSPAQFSSIDANRDGWITRSESRMSNAEFSRFDTNSDNRISRFEFENVASYSDNDRLDASRDHRLSRTEYDAEAVQTPANPSTARSAAWRTGSDRGIQEGRAAGRADYLRYQRWDLDGQTELEGADSGYTPKVGSLSDYQGGYREGFRNAYREGFYSARDNRFATFDINHDGWLTRSEWGASEAGFTRLDANRDHRLSRTEYDAEAVQTPANPSTARSAAWRTGSDRGIQEGRAAGRGDYLRDQRWDLEGQTELEGADSGYTPQVGSLSDYQGGYREGFRNAYREGFYSARDNR